VRRRAERVKGSRGRKKEEKEEERNRKYMWGCKQRGRETHETEQGGVGEGGAVRQGR